MTLSRLLSILALVSLTACGGHGSDPTGDSLNPQVKSKEDPCPIAVTNRPRFSSAPADTLNGFPTSDARGAGRISFANALSSQERGAFVSALDYLDSAQ